MDTELSRDFRRAVQAQAEQDRAKNGVSLVFAEVTAVSGNTVQLRRMGNDNPDGYPNDLYYKVVGGVPAEGDWVVGLDTLGGVIVLGSGGGGGGGGGVTDHGGLTGLGDDDHPQYLTPTEANALYKAIGYVPAWTEITGKPATFPPDLTSHLAASDPHTGYQKESEKDQNSGYVGLAATQGTRNGTKFLRDDGTWQVPAGGSKTIEHFFDAQPTADQVITYGTFTKVNFGTENADASGWFASSRFTPLVAGYYRIYVSLPVKSLADGDITFSLLYRNGVLSAELSRAAIRNTGTTNIPGTTLVEMNGSTDYIEIYTRINGSGGTPTVIGGSSTRFIGEYAGVLV